MAVPNVLDKLAPVPFEERRVSAGQVSRITANKTKFGASFQAFSRCVVRFDKVQMSEDFVTSIAHIVIAKPFFLGQFVGLQYLDGWRLGPKKLRE